MMFLVVLSDKQRQMLLDLGSWGIDYFDDDRDGQWGRDASALLLNVIIAKDEELVPPLEGVEQLRAANAVRVRRMPAESDD